MITIYHNGRCTKSRGALEILQEQSIPHNIRWYLAEPLNAKELRALLKKLGMKASELVRKSESYYKEHLKDAKLTQAEWLKQLTVHPELIERPIVETDNKAIVARPPERVLELL